MKNFGLFFILLSFIPLFVHSSSIFNCKDLQRMELDSTYQLFNNINCSEFSFVPIGSSDSPFSGSIGREKKSFLIEKIFLKNKI